MSNFEQYIKTASNLMNEMIEALNKLKVEVESCTVGSKEPEYRSRAYNYTDDEYYYIDNKNCTMFTKDTKQPVDNSRYKIGNYFHTEEHAQKLADLRNQCDPVTALLIEVTADSDWKPDWDNGNQHKAFVYFDCFDKWSAEFDCLEKVNGVFYFDPELKSKVLAALRKHFPNGYPN